MAATTLIDLLATGAQDAPALGAPGRDWLTYGGLRSHIAHTVTTMNGLGIGRGDRVAIVLPNGPDMASAFTAIAAGFTVSGALVMLVFRGALASLGPATIVESLRDNQPVVAPLARMEAWRDLGAALGPLSTGYALAYVSAEVLHGALAVLLPVALAFWMREGRR